MRIQILILGFKGLKSDKYESYETFKQMMIIWYDFSMAVNKNISKKEACLFILNSYDFMIFMLL